MEDIISKWINFRKTCIEIMPMEKRKELFPETLEDGYSWEAAGLADYIRVNMPPPNKACTRPPFGVGMWARFTKFIAHIKELLIKIGGG